jgi:hypothetical protein
MSTHQSPKVSHTSSETNAGRTSEESKGIECNICYDVIVIDNCIVSKLMGTGLRIRPISLEKKINPTFNINSLKKITYGSRLKDNKILQELSDGILKYEDLNFNSAV